MPTLNCTLMRFMFPLTSLSASLSPTEFLFALGTYLFSFYFHFFHLFILLIYFLFLVISPPTLSSGSSPKVSPRRLPRPLSPTFEVHSYHHLIYSLYLFLIQSHYYIIKYIILRKIFFLVFGVKGGRAAILCLVIFFLSIVLRLIISCSFDYILNNTIVLLVIFLPSFRC